VFQTYLESSVLSAAKILWVFSISSDACWQIRYLAEDHDRQLPNNLLLAVLYNIPNILDMTCI